MFVQYYLGVIFFRSVIITFNEQYFTQMLENFISSNERFQNILRMWFRIAEFLNSLHTGFRLLNLKNDNLRKRFDSIKYDLKKVEEVVYDLSIRGLSKVSLEDKAEEKTAAPSGPTEVAEAAPVAAV